MKRRMSLNFDDDVLTEIEEMAKRRGCSVSRLVNDILRMGLDSRSEMLKELDQVSLLQLVKGLKKAVKPLMGK